MAPPLVSARLWESLALVTARALAPALVPARARNRVNYFISLNWMEPYGTQMQGVLWIQKKDKKMKVMIEKMKFHMLNQVPPIQAMVHTGSYHMLIAYCGDMRLQLFGDHRRAFTSLGTVPCHFSISCLCYDSKADMLLSGTLGAVVTWFILPKGRDLQVAQTVPMAGHELVQGFSLNGPQGSLLVLCENTVRVFTHQGQGKLEEVKKFTPIASGSSITCSFTCVSQGSFYAGNRAGEIHAWGLDQGNFLHSFQAHSSSVICIHSRPDIHTLLTAGSEGLVREWSLTSGNLLRQLYIEEDLQKLQFIDSTTFFCQTAYTFSLHHLPYFYSLFHVCGSTPQQVQRVYCGRNWTRILCATEDGLLRFLSPVTGDLLVITWPLLIMDKAVAWAYDSDREELFVATGSSEVLVFDATRSPCTAKYLVCTSANPTDTVRCLAYAKSHLYIGLEGLMFCGHDSGIVRILSPYSCARTEKTVHSGTVLALSTLEGPQENSLLCSYGTDNIVHLTEAVLQGNKVVLQPLSKILCRCPLKHVILLPGSIGAIAENDCWCLWHYEDFLTSSESKQSSMFRETKRLHECAIASFDVCLSLKLFVTGGVDGSVRIWDFHGRLVTELDSALHFGPLCFANNRGDLLLTFNQSIYMVSCLELLPPVELIQLRVLNNTDEIPEVPKPFLPSFFFMFEIVFVPKFVYLGQGLQELAGLETLVNKRVIAFDNTVPHVVEEGRHMSPVTQERTKLQFLEDKDIDLSTLDSKHDRPPHVVPAQLRLAGWDGLNAYCILRGFFGQGQQWPLAPDGYIPNSVIRTRLWPNSTPIFLNCDLYTPYQDKDWGMIELSRSQALFPMALVEEKISVSKWRDKLKKQKRTSFSIIESMTNQNWMGRKFSESLMNHLIEAILNLTIYCSVEEYKKYFSVLAQIFASYQISPGLRSETARRLLDDRTHSNPCIRELAWEMLDRLGLMSHHFAIPLAMGLMDSDKNVRIKENLTVARKHRKTKLGNSGSVSVPSEDAGEQREARKSGQFQTQDVALEPELPLSTFSPVKSQDDAETKEVMLEAIEAMEVPEALGATEAMEVPKALGASEDMEAIDQRSTKDYGEVIPKVERYKHIKSVWKKALKTSRRRADVQRKEKQDLKDISEATTEESKEKVRHVSEKEEDTEKKLGKRSRGLAGTPGRAAETRSWRDDICCLVTSRTASSHPGMLRDLGKELVDLARVMLADRQPSWDLFQEIRPLLKESSSFSSELEKQHTIKGKVAKKAVKEKGTEVSREQEDRKVLKDDEEFSGEVKKQKVAFLEDHLVLEKRKFKKNVTKLAKQEVKIAEEKKKLTTQEKKLMQRKEKLTKDDKKLTHSEEKMAWEEEILASPHKKLTIEEQRLALEEKRLTGKERKLLRKGKKWIWKMRKPTLERGRLDWEKIMQAQEEEELSEEEEELAETEEEMAWEEAEQILDREKQVGERKKRSHKQKKHIQGKEKHVTEDAWKLGKLAHDHLFREEEGLSGEERKQINSPGERQERLGKKTERCRKRIQQLRKRYKKKWAEEEKRWDQKEEKLAQKVKQEAEEKKQQPREKMKLVPEEEKIMEEIEKGSPEEEKQAMEKEKQAKKQKKQIGKDEKAIEERKQWTREKEKVALQKEKLAPEKRIWSGKDEKWSQKEEKEVEQKPQQAWEEELSLEEEEQAGEMEKHLQEKEEQAKEIEEKRLTPKDSELAKKESHIAEKEKAIAKEGAGISKRQKKITQEEKEMKEDKLTQEKRKLAYDIRIQESDVAKGKKKITKEERIQAVRKLDMEKQISSEEKEASSRAKNVRMKESQLFRIPAGVIREEEEEESLSEEEEEEIEKMEKKEKEKQERHKDVESPSKEKESRLTEAMLLEEERVLKVELSKEEVRLSKLVTEGEDLAKERKGTVRREIPFKKERFLDGKRDSRLMDKVMWPTVRKSPSQMPFQEALGKEGTPLKVLEDHLDLEEKQDSQLLGVHPMTSSLGRQQNVLLEKARDMFLQAMETGLETQIPEGLYKPEFQSSDIIMEPQKPRYGLKDDWRKWFLQHHDYVMEKTKGQGPAPATGPSLASSPEMPAKRYQKPAYSEVSFSDEDWINNALIRLEAGEHLSRDSFHRLSQLLRNFTSKGYMKWIRLTNLKVIAKHLRQNLELSHTDTLQSLLPAATERSQTLQALRWHLLAESYRKKQAQLLPTAVKEIKHLSSVRRDVPASVYPSVDKKSLALIFQKDFPALRRGEIPKFPKAKKKALPIPSPVLPSTTKRIQVPKATDWHLLGEPYRSVRVQQLSNALKEMEMRHFYPISRDIFTDAHASVDKQTLALMFQKDLRAFKGQGRLPHIPKLEKKTQPISKVMEEVPLWETSVALYHVLRMLQQRYRKDSAVWMEQFYHLMDLYQLKSPQIQRLLLELLQREKLHPQEPIYKKDPKTKELAHGERLFYHLFCGSSRAPAGPLKFQDVVPLPGQNRVHAMQPVGIAQYGFLELAWKSLPQVNPNHIEKLLSIPTPTP
ncbi:PREDICTED: WD repeat-containing protein 87-like [Propithecus coquereli]|uniref:WD repeat-containing protein 87-like n=1 Tax=Propithecus coquereli TaxID=379532 RepID=UPI00063FC150|nr:PREDICTED: WD repeat-containing protein 87-like [Propithecus coquereli]